MVKLVIFDLDGVIVDSEVKNKERLFSFLRQYNSQITFEDVCKTAGFGNQQTKSYVGEMTGMDPEEAYSLYSQFKKTYKGISSYGEIINEDAVDLLEWLRENNYRAAVASSSTMKKLKVKLEESGTYKYFDYVLSAEEVTKGKPDPEIFLKTADHFGIDYKDCVVIEDSPVGIEAGKRAGMTVIARDNRILPVDTSKADFRTYDLKEAIDFIRTTE
ncbi:MAG: HAD family phosphatase [Erysipelotrichaceae bacterium]|nr:HAD family phosphatase [Erysipelotrichaceae bacterium]MBQ4253736.1 HAD family phosphatase [Erysipelotrichaceae bacterium]